MEKQFRWNNIIVYDYSVYQKQTDIESDILFLELAGTICSFKLSFLTNSAQKYLKNTPWKDGSCF
jgi:hypothetical protein